MSQTELFKKEVKRSIDKIKAQYKPEKIFIFALMRAEDCAGKRH